MTVLCSALTSSSLCKVAKTLSCLKKLMKSQKLTNPEIKVGGRFAATVLFGLLLWVTVKRQLIKVCLTLQPRSFQLIRTWLFSLCRERAARHAMTMDFGEFT